MIDVELHERDVRTALGRIHVRIGGAENSTALLFWPSLLMDGRMWSAQAAHFAGRHRVVLIDPPGHGGSSPLRAPFDFATCARALVQVLDGLGIDRVHHVGNSWGAMIGVTFAARYPERVGATVLMNGTASPAGIRQKAEYRALLAAIRVAGFRGPLAGAAVDAFVGPTSKRQRPHVVDAVRASIRGLDVASVAHAVRSIVPRRPDQRPLLKSITAPTLVVAGREDATFPVAETKQLADGIPDATFVVIEDAAHLAALEVPERVNALIETFLASVG